MSDTTLVHRCEGRDCGVLSVDDAKVIEVIGNGHTALLDVVCEGDLATVAVRVVSSEGRHPYVALSHVWVDGLGNASANALPRCQLAYVANVLKGLRAKIGEGNGKLMVWLDTLCCPVRSPEHRSICLERMTAIYRDAAYVLVLDGPLGHVGVSEIDVVEICMRLKYSGWMRRLWTLQEGVHAKRLWLQLKDEAVDLDVMESELVSMHKSDFVHEAFLTPLVAFIRNLRGLIHRERQWHATGLEDVIRAFKERSVSVAADEPLCLSNCMGLKQRDIVRVPPAERMKTFWRVLGEHQKDDLGIPKSIVFFREARLTESGYRWAPASVMHKTEFDDMRRVKTPDESANITPNGLLARYAAVEVEVPEIFNEADTGIWEDVFADYPGTLFVREEGGIWLLVDWNTPRDRLRDSTSVPAYVRSNGGTQVFLAAASIDCMFLDRNSREATKVLSGSIVDESAEQMQFHAGRYALLGRFPDSLVFQLEAAWQLLQDPTLRMLLSPSAKDHEEPPLDSSFPKDRAIEVLPNDSAKKLFELVDVAMQEAGVSRSYGALPVGDCRKNLAGLVMCLHAVGYGEVVRTWPSSQLWCVD